ncbi:hypothetical protein KIN20_026244 [Parelaphostrongylus tenuis]|uniref:Uncharacterized protein n=1 Tax=Parelaphostrongylus tenuis TaxID=148309 RepID=A0AAD5MWH5_PARTN|nr:hypothetical protein KIN20_026244 [Parelaphostrongylus tenuis]
MIKFSPRRYLIALFTSDLSSRRLISLQCDAIGQMHEVHIETSLCGDPFHLDGKLWCYGSIQVFAQATRTISNLNTSALGMST